jgi:hyperosmotically inducible protein
MQTLRKQPILMLVALAAIAMMMATTACMSTVSPKQQLKDSEITAAVKTSFAADPDVAAHNIDVDTVEGVVTLTGKVKSDDEKAKAGRLARNTGGVKRVNNNLLVGQG